MAEKIPSDAKVFQGARVRRLRRQRGLTQAAMAEALGISTAYLNLIERNQRPITAQVLLRLADAFDVDLRSLAGGDEEAHLVAGLREVFADPLFRGRAPGNQDVKDLAAASPEASQAVIALYAAYREATSTATDLAEREARREGTEPARFPAEEVRDALRARNNHFPELEEAAEALHARAGLERDELFAGLRAHLRRAFGAAVAVVPVDVMPATLRRFDRHRNRVLLSEMLSESGRVFQLAFQIAVMEHGPLLDRLVAEAALQGDETLRLYRVTLANYFAGAVMMPYDRFLSAAESLRYDVDVLAQRFGASFEQACHRLTTMQRPGARGVPFFMIRVDNAGNVSKRFSATSFQFARLGGACPRWNVHDAFRTPGRIVTQAIQMPDGATYFSLARTVTRPGMGAHVPEQQLALALGCEIAHARRLVYADGMDLESPRAATPIGVTCRLCPREDCGHRAFPPLNRRLVVTEHRRDLSPFAFTDD